MESWLNERPVNRFNLQQLVQADELVSLGSEAHRVNRRNACKNLSLCLAPESAGRAAEITFNPFIAERSQFKMLSMMRCEE
jgi:hypothetical protein